MKKLLRNMLAVMASVLMMFGTMTTAFAAESTYTITINNSASGHTYEAYQIFAGELNEGVLSNVTWGTGVNGTALLASLKADTAIGAKFTSASTAADVAKAMDGITADSAEAQAFAQAVGKNLTTASAASTAGTGTYKISGLNAGYYLVKDQNDTQDTKNDAYTRFILQVVKDVTAQPKSAVPTVEKKVLENTKTVTYSDADTEEKVGAGYNDVADYNIGDAVPFELIGTMPANYADYASYTYAFNDTASAGLSINADSVHVYVNGTEITTGFTSTVNGQTLTVSFADTKKVSSINASSVVTVKYTATLNSSAVIGLDGNPNEVYLTYSNNPNQSGTGDTGKTPTDKVIVFTYELDTTKVDASDATKKLAGAEFQLYKLVNNEKNYAVVADGKVTGWTADAAKATTLVSGTDGLFKVAGLDDASYYLHESKAPAGYNLLTSDVALTIAATTANNQEWTTESAADALTALKITVGTTTNDGVVKTGVVNAAVQNSKGATLPSTGGIGTTIFYVVGGAMIIGACVLLFRRKHSEN